MRSDRVLQRRVAVAVVTVDFELLQINRQLVQRKRADAARREIEPRTALRFGPMHVIGMPVSHATTRGSCLGSRKLSSSSSMRGIFNYEDDDEEEDDSLAAPRRFEPALSLFQK